MLQTLIPPARIFQGVTAIGNPFFVWSPPARRGGPFIFSLSARPLFSPFLSLHAARSAFFCKAGLPPCDNHHFFHENNAKIAHFIFLMS